MSDLFEDAPVAPEPSDQQSEALAVWMIEAYETLKKARDLLAQIAPAAPLLDEIEQLIERAEEPYPTEVSVQPEAGAEDHAAAPAPVNDDLPTEYRERLAEARADRREFEESLVPEHQRDELFDPNEIVEPTHALAEFEAPELPEADGELTGPTEAVQALALMLILCRLLLENNGEAASGAFVNEALSIVESLWPLVPAEVKADAEAHTLSWEEKAGW